MRWGIRVVVSVACALACAAAAAGEGEVAARFEGDKTLVVEFRQPMRTWDNAVRDDAVRITPALPAKCAWHSDARLSCTLDKTPADATRYRIDVAAGLVSQDGTNLGAQHAWVETQRPRLSTRIQDWSAGEPSIVIDANMPVDAEAVRAVLRLQVDGSPVRIAALRWLPPQWRGDTRAHLAVKLPALARDKRLLTLDVVPGLRALPGPLPGEQKERLLAARLHEPFALRGVTCAKREEREFTPARDGVVDARCTPGAPILLMFTRSLETEAAERIGARVPAGIYVSQGWEGEGFRDAHAVIEPARPIRVSSPAPNTRLEFVLDGSIRSSDGAVLPPTTVRIVMGDARPQVRASNGNALVADGDHPPVLLELVNAEAARVQVSGVARRSGNETVQAKGGPHSATPIASAVASRTLAEGGWVRWSTGEPDARAQRNEVEFAAPGFDLLAVAGRREVLAWANEWDRDAPVAGANVELLWRDRDDAEPRIATRGRTGPDGTVLLRLPDDLVVPGPGEGEDRWNWHGPSWLLRAVDATGERRAVLPVGRTDYGQATGLAPVQKMWGVSDRPLYRAGDTVHYRLWQREQDGAALRVPRSKQSLKLRLFDTEREKTVLAWQATPDAEGSLAGDLALPIHLTDATYCIGIDDGRGETDGSCFFVGTYRAQDLWVEAKSKGGVLRDGDRYVADVKAGYFSGGVAAGVDADDITLGVWALALGDAYPQYRDFEFVDVHDEDVEDVDLKNVPERAELDGAGTLRIDLPVAFDSGAGNRPAFGLLGLDVSVSPEDREGTVAHDEATRYARFARYVGLKASPAWFDRDDKVSLEAVVITAQGEPVAANVEVVVEYLPDYRGKGKAERLARCLVRTGVSTPCDFSRQRSGFYRLTASSDGAAPAKLTQYVWGGDAGVAGDVDDPELSLLDASPQRSAPIRMLVRQNFPQARALFVIGSGGTILGHRIETLVGNAQNVALPVAPAWRGRLTVEAYIRESVAAQVVDGYRKPVATEALDLLIPEAEPLPASTPIAVRFQPATAKPGTHATLLLRNDTKQPRSVAVAVTDDALRAQAQRWLPYADPQGATGFAQWLNVGSGSLLEHGFSDWKGGAWQSWLSWPESGAGLLAPPPEQRSRQVDAESASVAFMRNQSDGYNEATTLDRIEVTGSRIRRVDIVESSEAKAPDPSLPPRQDAQSSASAIQAVRAQFADTALWLPAVTLAPGESRRIDVALPDNLTRWRAVAWSVGGADDFAMADAALEAGLPVEARLQTPVRVYPGDESRVATHVRHVAAEPATAQTLLRTEGPDGASDDAQSLRLSARGQGSVATVLHPQTPGALRLVAEARTPGGRDAVAADIEVASPLIAARKVQAGWIADAPLSLALPALPDGAQDPSLRVALLRGNVALATQWTDDLHRYPHRCWEQILSRAVGAALALERHDGSWPDAAATVQEALDNAAVFQTHQGGFVYFPGASGGWYSQKANVPLTAYTVRALALLQTLGHPVPAQVVESARTFLANTDATPPARGEAKQEDEDERLAKFAFAAASQPPEQTSALDTLWQRWDRLALPAQVAAAQALARAGHPSAASAVERLLKQAPLRGATRSLRLLRRYDQWMSSDLREQCALIGLLRDYPALAPAPVRRELLAGLGDLYAGGVPSVDTQTAAYCLMALRDPQGTADGPAQVRFALGAQQRTLALAQGEEQASWAVGAPADAPLQIAANSNPDVPLSYVAELDYVEDARQAQSSAVGFQLERDYAVLRAGAWAPVAAQTLREGDWIRVTLTIDTSAPREFVAVTDSVPGGLRPTDLELSGVATTDLQEVGDEGSRWFGTRKLDARSPRFYAESLPSGRHQVHYFARVGNAGDYLAAPAEAELMYGAATRARTAAARLRFKAE